MTGVAEAWLDFGWRLVFGIALVRDALPQHLAGALVERDELPGVLRHVVRRLDVAVEAGADAGGRIAADGGRHEHAIAPHDRARHGDARRSVSSTATFSPVATFHFTGVGVPVGDAGRGRSAERRPVLRGQRRRGEHSDRDDD